MKDKELKPEKVFQTLRIDTPLRQLNDKINEIVETWSSMLVEDWNHFCEKQLYETYKKYEISKVFVISEKDFKRFLLWALPKWYEMIKEKDNENKKTN